MDEAAFRAYAKAWRRRQMDEERSRVQRARRAREVAETVARMLVREYGAEEVWLFGSLARRQESYIHSDIDLAATGLPAREFFRILSRVNAVSQFAIDLVDLEACPTGLATVIRREGRILARREAKSGG
ncbi:MAG TPA: DNA polymerase subunit beta [Desulfotomaculum sp.]|nr:DNA polymerase subunit beta [Desulfotomaculum sp.]